MPAMLNLRSSNILCTPVLIYELCMYAVYARGDLKSAYYWLACTL